MKVFIGSSREQEDRADEVARWLEKMGVDAIVWNEIGTFIPGQYTLDDLVRLSDNVDAAIFIFAADDKTWYRKDIVETVRDNVLFEYGLFCGKLSREKVIFITIGNPRLATDLHGITYIKLGDSNRDAKGRLKDWIQFIDPSGEKTNRIDIKAERVKVFDDKGYGDQTISVNDTKADNWIEITVDFTHDYVKEFVFAGVVISDKNIDISRSGSAIIDFAFVDAGLNKIDLELKNHKDNKYEKFSITNEMINNNKCVIDLSPIDNTMLKNIDEIVLCTRPSHFTDKDNKTGKYMIRSISFI